VNARGRISFPPGSRSYARQKRLLEAERIQFHNDTIDLQLFGWGRRQVKKKV
jgi:methylated-DNA-protein-cysteine methyltransferase-like protein